MDELEAKFSTLENLIASLGQRQRALAMRLDGAILTVTRILSVEPVLLTPPDVPAIPTSDEHEQL
jgi:hypothetical protein